MPWTESQDIRNRRLILNANALVFKRINQSQPEEHEIIMYAAWLDGGVKASLALLAVDERVNTLWGNGDKMKAHALLAVFTYAVMSRWLRYIDEPLLKTQWGYSDEMRLEYRETLAANILHYFDDDSEKSVSDIMKLDAQFNYDRDIHDKKDKGRRFNEMNLLILRAQIACGMRYNLDLENIPIPLTGVDDRVNSGIPDSIGGPTQWIGIATILIEAENHTLEWMTAWIKKLADR